MPLLPQDVLVALKLALWVDDGLTYAQLGAELGLSASQAHAAVRRAAAAGLLNLETRTVIRPALTEFLLHGAKYVWPVRPGPIVRGLATAHAAPPLNTLLVGDSAPMVWPDPKGETRGESIAPIHRSVPAAARRDPKLYAALALVDALRVGRARDRKLAATKLQELLSAGAD